MRSGTDVIKSVMKDKKKELEAVVMIDKKMIAKVIKDFVTKESVLVYGGVALNAVLPKDLKFYRPGEYPDYDCMSTDAKKHSMKLADALHDAGFQYVEVREAVHEGTYKVFVNFEAVADVTQVRPKFFEEMMKIGKTIRGMHTAPLYYMKHSVIKELARPDGSYYRWPKVYQRSKLLDKIVRFDKVTELSESPPLITDKEVSRVLKSTMAFLRVHKVPVVGTFAVKKILGLTGVDYRHDWRLDPFFSFFDVLSMNALETFDLMKKHVELSDGWELVGVKRFFYQEVLPKRIRVYLKKSGSRDMISLVTIMNTQEDCYSVMNKGRYVLGNPYTVLQYLYAYWLVYYTYEASAISDNVNTLIASMEAYIHTKASGDEKFTGKCFGVQKTITDVMKERWNNGDGFVYRP